MDGMSNKRAPWSTKRPRAIRTNGVTIRRTGGSGHSERMFHEPVGVAEPKCDHNSEDGHEDRKLDCGDAGEHGYLYDDVRRRSLWSLVLPPAGSSAPLRVLGTVVPSRIASQVEQFLGSDED